jgi:hypothetical protein
MVLTAQMALTALLAPLAPLELLVLLVLLALLVRKEYPTQPLPNQSLVQSVTKMLAPHIRSSMTN